MWFLKFSAGRHSFYSVPHYHWRNGTYPIAHKHTPIGWYHGSAKLPCHIITKRKCCLLKQLSSHLPNDFGANFKCNPTDAKPDFYKARIDDISSNEVRHFASVSLLVCHRCGCYFSPPSLPPYRSARLIDRWVANYLSVRTSFIIDYPSCAKSNPSADNISPDNTTLANR